MHNPKQMHKPRTRKTRPKILATILATILAITSFTTPSLAATSMNAEKED